MNYNIEDTFETYQGNDLGSFCSSQGTFFRVWAPTAGRVLLRIYEAGDGENMLYCREMEQAEQGTWIKHFQENLQGRYYTYQVYAEGKFQKETIDPYAKACGVNGLRGMILDLRDTDPEGFAQDHGPVYENAVDIIVAETSVCDATIDASAHSSYPGKYLGLAESGTSTDGRIATGLDHLVEMGVTHVQLMPFYDFASVDEAAGKGYNWGYDPFNYNIPEGSYATDPYRGEVRIRECKQMIQAIHKKGLGVIMDVVYNHVYNVERSCFQRTVPDYYFRKYTDQTSGKEYLSNGSGCGNEIASEKTMVRKYLIDALCYWVKEYHIDGFRFDLMGVLDIETLNLAADKLRQIRPDIILYGEGWTGGTCAYPDDKRALKGNASQLNGIGMFSDDIRDHVKGHVFDSRSCGFANGEKGKENDIRFSVAAVRSNRIGKEYHSFNNNAWALRPDQIVNYVSCHDNLTLWDKLSLSCPEKTEKERLAINRLCAAIIFTAQGIPFFLEGEEFARSKPIRGTNKVSENSYNRPAFTNGLRYNRINAYRELYDYYCGLIAFRKAHSALRLRSREEIEEQLHFLKDMPDQVVAFRVTDAQEEILVVYNAGKKAVIIDSGIADDLHEDGIWEACIIENRAGTECMETYGRMVSVAGQSAFAAVRKK